MQCKASRLGIKYRSQIDNRKHRRRNDSHPTVELWKCCGMERNHFFDKVFLIYLICFIYVCLKSNRTAKQQQCSIGKNKSYKSVSVHQVYFI